MEVVFCPAYDDGRRGVRKMQDSLFVSLIEQKPGITPSEVAERFGVSVFDSPTMPRPVKALEGANVEAIRKVLADNGLL